MLIQLVVLVMMGAFVGLMNLPTRNEIEDHKGSWIELWGRMVLIALATILLVVMTLTYHR